MTKYIFGTKPLAGFTTGQTYDCMQTTGDSGFFIDDNGAYIWQPLSFFSPARPTPFVVRVDFMGSVTGYHLYTVQADSEADAVANYASGKLTKTENLLDGTNITGITINASQTPL